MILQNAGAGLDAQLRVVVKARVICCVGILTTVYFVNGADPDVRERVCQALDLYVKTIGDKLVWGSDPVTHHPRAVAGTNILSPRSWMAGVQPIDGLSLTAHGGRKGNDADPYFVHFLAREIRRGELSYFSFGLPFEWMATHEAGAYPRLVVSFCETLRPVHGYGGLAHQLAHRHRRSARRATGRTRRADRRAGSRGPAAPVLDGRGHPGGAAAAARRRAPPGTDAFLHPGRARFEADPD